MLSVGSIARLARRRADPPPSPDLSRRRRRSRSACAWPLTAARPNVALACVGLLLTGAAAFCFVTLCSTTLQLHSSPAYRGRIMALWVFVYIGTTPIGSVLTGGITAAGGPRVALLVGAGACLVAAGDWARGCARRRTPTTRSPIWPEWWRQGLAMRLTVERVARAGPGNEPVRARGGPGPSLDRPSGVRRSRPGDRDRLRTGGLGRGSSAHPERRG